MNSSKSAQTCRGIAGFHCVKPKFIYQHKDATPKKLGVKILNELREYEPFEFDYIEEKIWELKAVPEYGDIQPKNKQQLIRQISEHLIDHKAITNYEIFRPLQGTLEPWMSGKIGFYPDGTNFVHDSYFCKWGYVANFDNQHFEILRGDQTVAPTRKIYGLNNGTLNPVGTIHTDPFGEYFPCRIVQSYPFTELPSDRQFLSDLQVYRNDPHAGLETQRPLQLSDYQI